MLNTSNISTSQYRGYHDTSNIGMSRHLSWVVSWVNWYRGSIVGPYIITNIPIKKEIGTLCFIALLYL